MLVWFSIQTCHAQSSNNMESLFRFSAYLTSIEQFKSAEDILKKFKGSHQTDRVRFEIAKLYYLQGRNEEADDIIEELLANNWRDRELVSLFKVTREKYALWNPDWSYSYQTLQTRNPNKRAKSGTYNLFGWELNYENPEDDDFFGFVHNVGVSMRLPNRSLLTGGYRLTDYEQSFADRQYTHLKLETSYWGHLKPSPFIKLEGNWQEGYDDQIISLGVKQRFRETWGGIDVEFSAGDVKARQSDNSSGYRYMSEITYRPHARRIGQSYFVYAQDFDLNGDHLKNQIIGAGLSYQLSYGRYFGSFSSRYSERKFENTDPFWGTVREDETINSSVELCRAAAKRFSLCVRYAHEDTQSTINFYDNEGPDFGIYVRGTAF
jgi:tetratricopeptide (TPR) repeat protein